MGLGGKSSKSSKNGFGDVGGVENNSNGMSVGDFGGDGDFDVWMGAGGGELGVFVGGGVVIVIGDCGGGVGVAKVMVMSSLMGDEMVSGDDSLEELMLTKQQGLTLILAVFLQGLVDGEDLIILT